jgi:predicted SAM-dependent methyltransferase
MEEAGVRIDPDIEYCGFAVDRFLHEQLCAADIALAPLNMTDEPDGPIARYSIPSRLTEYMNAGVPVFAAAGRQTDAYRFMSDNGVAVCSTLADEEAFVDSLLGFMRDANQRREVGKAARRFAEERFDVVRHREWLRGEFQGLVDASLRIASAPAAPTVATPVVERSEVRLARMMSDKVHYACGRRVLDGWLNVDMFDDAYPYGPPDNELRDRIFYADLRAPHPFPDNTFQFAYCEDFLEHVTQADSLIFIAEVYRALRKGGVFRISTPGLPGILRRHLRSSDHAGGATCRQEAYVHWHHLHFYCFESIQVVARHIGFSKVTQCQYGRSEHPDLEQDSRPNQADLNLVVELTK